MVDRSTRRRFLTTTGGMLAAAGDWSFLSRLSPVSAAEAKLDTNAVQFQPEIEPLVRLLEETPRKRLLEEVAARIQAGTSYREIVAALLLAGIRNVQPRPHVGFKFHAVLVVNSAHLASLSSPDDQRWLPIFWALDYFKHAQKQDAAEGDWTMPAVKPAALPPAGKARQKFIEAMDRWDEQAADEAIAGFARGGGANEIYELMFRYGSRDFRSIGHKAIYVANSFRTLQCIGWEHAEPVLRSLAYALLNYDGDNPARSDHDADRPWKTNTERAGKIRNAWQDGKTSDEATRDLLATLRDGAEDDACDHAVKLINGGVDPQSVWDGVLCGAGELLMRRPGIVALHAVTSANALRFCYQAAGREDTRKLLLLQAAAFVPLFRKELSRRGGSIGNDRIDAFEPAAPEGSEVNPLPEIFADVSENPRRAAAKTLHFLSKGGTSRDVIGGAREMVFRKGNDAHDYKFSSAMLEDYYHVSPGWRNRFLASGMFIFPGSGQRDNRLVQRTQEALSA